MLQDFASGKFKQFCTQIAITAKPRYRSPQDRPVIDGELTIHGRNQLLNVCSEVSEKAVWSSGEYSSRGKLQGESVSDVGGTCLSSFARLEVVGSALNP